MGKSPGKWIKSVLFGKKSSKSSLSKGREKLVKRSADAEGTLVSANLPASDLRSIPPPLTSHPLPGACTGNGVDSNLLPDGAVFGSGRQDGDAQTGIHLGLPNDREKIRHEQAITKVQAAAKGFLARRAFGALKGIIRLQALVRGHLVRRQAVATLCCVMRIVKFQASIRSQIAMRSGISIQVDEKQSMKINMVYSLWKRAFLRKLLASSPNAMPLRLQYSTGAPNSSWEWLERWTKLRFWDPKLKQKKISDSKSKLKPGSAKTRDGAQGRPKRGVERLQNGTPHNTSDLDKNKQNFRKFSFHSTESSTDHPQREISKIKRNLKKISNNPTETSVRLEKDVEKPKCTQKKASSSATEVFEQSTVDTAGEIDNDITMTMLMHSDDGVEKTQKGREITDSKHFDEEDIGITEDCITPPVAAELIDPMHDNVTTNFHPIMGNGKGEDVHRTVNGSNCADDLIGEDNQITNKKRDSLLAKQDDEKNGLHNTTRVPSYMAATESAKAKLRMQGSPKLGDDGTEKNGYTRRHSLPSLTNGKFTSLSPRVQKLVQSSGKGGIRNDTSLNSSRDGNDKVVQPGWRR